MRSGGRYVRAILKDFSRFVVQSRQAGVFYCGGLVRQVWVNCGIQFFGGREVQDLI
jgi:hypothetical protein